MRPSFGCARGGKVSAEITEALGLPLRPKNEQGTNPVKELVPGAVWLRKGEPRRTGLISDYHRLPARLRLHSTCAQWSLVVSGCAIEVDEHSGGAAGFGAAPGG